MPLPPVVQAFEVNASAFLAGIDEMIAGTDKLAASIDAAAAATGRLSAAADVGAGADERFASIEAAIEEQTVRLEGELGTLVGIMDEAAVASQRAADSLDMIAAGEAKAGDAAVVAGDKAKGASAEAAGFGSLMKTAFLGVAIAAVYGIDKAAKFQSSMEQLHTQAGVAQSKIAGLSQQVLQLSSQVGFSPESLSESLYHVASNMASLGATGPQMLGAVKVAAEGAQVGGANLVDVTNALGAAIASGIPGVQNYTSAMGYLNATVGAGDMHMQDLADAFGTGVLANIKLYGVTLRDVSAALATFGDNNIRGAVAGTDLRVAVQAMVKPVATAKATLAELGLNARSFADAMKNGGLNSALQLLITRMHAAGISAKDEGQVITDLFGKKAGGGIGVLVGEFDRFQSKYAAVKAGADQFAGDWSSRTQTMAQQWDNLKSGAQALAISFGTVLLPAATKVVGALARFATMLEQHPALAAFAGALLAVAVAFKVVATAEAIFEAATMADPVMLVVMAIIALVAGLYELYTHSKLVRDVVADVGHFFADVWRGAMRLAGEAIRWFEDGPLKDIEKAIAYFKAWWAANGAEVEQVWRGLWGAIKVVAETYVKIVFTGIRLALSLMLDYWRVVWGLVRDTFMLAWNVIAAATRTEVHVIMDIISIFLDVVTGHWSKAWRDCQKLFSDAVHGIASIASAFGSGLIRLFTDLGRNLVQGLINGVKSMFGAVGSIMSSLGNGAVGALKSALHIFSPSRATYEIGVLTAQGLADGLAASTAPASAASKVATDLLAAVKEAASRGVIGLGAASSLSQWLTNDNSRVAALAAQRATIAKTIAAADKYAATTTSNTEQAFGLMNAAGSTPFTAGDIARNLQQDVSQIVAFKANIQKLAKMGLNRAYINELIQAGPVQGGQVAAELASGSWADIRSINSAESAIASASTSLGQTAANAMYDSGRNAGKGFLSGLQAQESAITRMMQQIAKSMVNTVKRELGIRSPSTVFMEHGRMVALGLALGMEDGKSRVTDASRVLAGAASMPPGGIGGIGAGGGGGTVTINVHVDGYVGNNQELAGEIFRVVQAQALRNNHRNPTNGLALAFGR